MISLLAVTGIFMLAGTSRALAGSCPGATSCPYAGASVIGQRAEGVFRFPQAVAIGPAGDVYVADQQTYAVQKFSAAGVYETEWGTQGAGAGQFGAISGLATDAQGDVYVVDATNNRVDKFDPTGAPITSWGSAGNGLGCKQVTGRVVTLSADTPTSRGEPV